MPPTVSVTIVTHNSQSYIERCLRSVFRQTYRPVEVVIVDNASTDGTREILARFEERTRVIYNHSNLGFAAAQNQAIAASSGAWVLTLNPDVLLLRGFLEALMEGAELDPKVGSVCGRLLSSGPNFEPLDRRVFDSTGIYVTPSMRHFDRGWGEPDDGRYQETEYVFGACAAAALYRRAMIAGISQGDDFFDPDFFTYREDADVAWRAQLLGWRCLYVPRAAGYHVRTVRQGERRAAPAIMNMHSVKNRFLMRVKNATGGLYRRFWLPATARDLLVVAGCLLCEQRSLEAFWRLAKCLPRALARRKWIMARRAAADGELARWFSAAPSSQPLAEAQTVGLLQRRQAV